MKIEQHLTWVCMRKNSRRTMATIFGVVLCVAMITALTCFCFSLQAALIRSNIEYNGSYEGGFSNITYEQAQQIKQDKRVDEAMVFYTDRAQLAMQERTIEVIVQGVKQEDLSIKGNTIQSGHYPKARDEIMISQQLQRRDPDTMIIGNTITLNLLRYQKELESWEEGGSKTYTICGIVNSTMDDAVITQFDEAGVDMHNQLSTYITFRSLKNVEQQLEDMRVAYQLPADSIDLNRELLMYMGVLDLSFLKTLLLAGGVVAFLVLLGGVSLIYNSFAISLNERTRYLGMLSSVGATRKQKTRSICFEAFVIGCIAIPIGFLLGIGGLALIFTILDTLLTSFFHNSNLHLQVVINGYTLIFTLVFTIVLLAISVWKPSHRASQITAVQAIRQNEDIKIHKRDIKTSRWTSCLFGFEGTLAMKNIKRNRSRYRAVLSSFTICMILLLSAVTMTHLLKSSMQPMFRNQADVSFWMSDPLDTPGNRDAYVKSIGTYYSKEKMEPYKTVAYADAAHIFNHYTVSIQNDAYLSDEGRNLLAQYHHVDVPELRLEESNLAQISIFGLQDEELREYCETLHISMDELKRQEKMILVNAPLMNHNGIRKVDWLQAPENGVMNGYLNAVQEMIETPNAATMLDTMTIAATTNEEPKVLAGNYNYPNAYFITSYDTVNTRAARLAEKGAWVSLMCEVQYKSEHPDELVRALEGMHVDINTLRNNARDNEKASNQLLLMNVFIFGFVALLLIICITNIINTMTTSIQLRRREFAMLRSVGITKQQFYKMILYESMLYGIKTCIYGLPLSVVIMLLLSRIFQSSFDQGIVIPWMVIVLTVLGLFIILISIQLLSIRKNEQDSIVEIIRQESI